MLNKKQQQIVNKFPELKSKVVEALMETKGKDIKEKAITRVYKIFDNSEELLEIIDCLLGKVKDAKAEAGAAITLAAKNGRKLISLQNGSRFR